MDQNFHLLAEYKAAVPIKVNKINNKNKKKINILYLTLQFIMNVLFYVNIIKCFFS